MVSPAVPKTFVTTRLPWLIGACGLVVYLATLNHWVSLSSLGSVARVSGWLWQPDLQRPLNAILLAPFRLLPETWVPFTLNLFAAFCATAVLVLLARSVALLRHDVGPRKSLPGSNDVMILDLPAAWIPPVLAALVCGLQLTFWEHATAWTGHIIDLLLFAFVVRCLLEFRIDQNKSWISRSALVVGAGMANNWGMIGFFPVYIAAVLWITGLRILYDRPWFLRTALWGFAGLSFYLVLPAVQALSADSQLDFWTALKANLKSQQEMLTLLRRPAFRVLALTSLLPLLVISIRWKAHSVQFSDDSALGVFLLKSTAHFVHALFFLTAIWVALDPVFSPRNLKLGMPMLTYYYLSALVAGYCAGYFLLMRKGNVPRLVGRLAAGTVWVLVCIMPLALLARNFGQIRQTNGPKLREFADEVSRDLPAGKVVVLSDDPQQLFLLRAVLNSRAQLNVLPLDVKALGSAQYHVAMAEQFPSRWPRAYVPTNQAANIGPIRIMNLVSRFRLEQPVYYLHPGFGSLFERFTSRPSGFVHLLEPRKRRNLPAGEAEPHEPLPDSESKGLDESEAGSREQALANNLNWHQRWTNSIERFVQAQGNQSGAGPTWRLRMQKALRLAPNQNGTALGIGAIYSRALNHWGVQLQRREEWTEANAWFQRAVALNSENLAALINLEYNQRFQRGEKQPLDPNWLQNQFYYLSDKYSDWMEMLYAAGPVDEPTILLRVGRSLFEARNYRQATVEFARCVELAPEWLKPRAWLALSYINTRNFTNAVELTDDLTALTASRDVESLCKLLMCRTTALQATARTNEATQAIESFINQFRGRKEVLSLAMELYGRNAQYDRTGSFIDELLKEEPNNLDLLSRKGRAELALQRYHSAIEILTQVVARAPSQEQARLDLAIARLSVGQLDAAGAEYRKLLATEGQENNALFGLGGIAWRKCETNAAIELYQQFLSNSVPGTRQYGVASERLKHLKAGKSQ